jgi:hypothetical protein
MMLSVLRLYSMYDKMINEFVAVGAMRTAKEVKVLGEKPALVPLRMLHDLTWAAAVPRITAR